MKLEDCGLELSAYLTDEQGHITWFCYEDTDTDTVYVGGSNDLSNLRIMLFHRERQRLYRSQQDQASASARHLEQLAQLQILARQRENTMIWGSPQLNITGSDATTGTIYVGGPNSSLRNITLHTSEAGMQLLNQAFMEEMRRQANPPMQ